MFQNQHAALIAAAQLVEVLPAMTVFAVEVTDEDTYEEPSVMNIYVTNHEETLKMRARLSLWNPIDTGEHFISFQIGSLLVSIIEEEKNERRTDAPAS